MKATLGRERDKIKANLEGIRRMEKMPGAMFIIDTRREHIAVKEARKLGVPTIALIDTDSDPELIDLPIPGNDDAMRAIEIIMAELADAIIDAKQGRGADRVTRPAARALAAAAAASSAPKTPAAAARGPRPAAPTRRPRPPAATRPVPTPPPPTPRRPASPWAPSRSPERIANDHRIRCRRGEARPRPVSFARPAPPRRATRDARGPAGRDEFSRTSRRS